jgi:hypothetical protein
MEATSASSPGGAVKKPGFILIAACVAIFVSACGGSGASNSEKAPPAQPAAPAEPEKPAAPAIPPEIEQVAENTLGSETEVLVYGDLALTGKQQILMINRLKKTPEGKTPGTLLSRAAIVENDGGKWKQVLLCDQHLKNTKGFLAATPVADVPTWRLQYEQHEDKGLVMYFTPLDKPAGGYLQTIGIRWNKKVGRYQSLDRNYENFLGETPSLDVPDVSGR